MILIVGIVILGNAKKSDNKHHRHHHVDHSSDHDDDDDMHRDRSGLLSPQKIKHRSRSKMASSDTSHHILKKKKHHHGHHHYDPNVIIPIKKEPLSAKAIRGVNLIGQSLQKTAETAVQSAVRVKRDIKSYFSSDFEVLLLRMTRPDDTRPDSLDVDRFLATTETFVRNMDMTSQSNPYRVTLRKLWTKTAESDGRTVLKSLYLMHTLFRYSQPEDALIFKNLLNKMSKETCKKSESKYFDIIRARSSHPKTTFFEDFITRYNSYVLKRAKAFTSSFEEMKLIGRGMRTEDICAQV